MGLVACPGWMLQEGQEQQTPLLVIGMEMGIEVIGMEMGI
jgi:hypothetical protein